MSMAPRSGAGTTARMGIRQGIAICDPLSNLCPDVHRRAAPTAIKVTLPDQSAYVPPLQIAKGSGQYIRIIPLVVPVPLTTMYLE